MLAVTTGPSDIDGLDYLCGAQSEMGGHHGLGRISGAGFDLPCHRLAVCRQPNMGADRISVTLFTYQIDAEPVSCFAQFVEIDGRSLCVVVDYEVEPSILVEISHRHTTAVINFIRADGTGDVYKITVTDVGEQTIVFISVPRILTDKICAEEKPLLVRVNRCYRTGYER